LIHVSEVRTTGRQDLARGIDRVESALKIQ
jgi:hypothetical protein